MQNNVKLCKKCNTIKNTDCFYKYNNRIRGDCKDCHTIDNRERYRNKPIINSRTLQNDTKNGWKFCTKCNKKKSLDNFDKDLRYNLFLTQCKNCLKNKTNKNRNKRRKNNRNYRLRTNISNRIRRVLRGIRKSDKCMNLIGCSLEVLINHLESLFEPGMTWENRGYGHNRWHIDHILPCSLFDLSDTKQQKICFNYKNLRPVWQQINLNKNDKLPNGISAQQMTNDEKLQYLIELGLF